MTKLQLIKCLFYACLYAIPALIILWYVRMRIYLPLRQRALYRLSVKRGHLVIAKRIEREQVVPNISTKVYQYECSGQIYNIELSDGLPEVIELYYLKNPQKACCKKDLGYKEVPWLYFYIGAVVVIFLLLTLPKIGVL